MRQKIKFFFIFGVLIFFLAACGSKEINKDLPEAPVQKEEVSAKKEETSEKENLKKIQENNSEKNLTEKEDDFSDDEFDDDFLEDDELDEEYVKESDPLYYFNLAMFHVTDKTYYWILKPIAQGYRFIMPEMVRVWVRNFFYNLGMPVRFVSNLLQFKFLDATKELGRFVINSTVGILGFGNPAGYFESLTPSPEDLGQAFGKWGIGEGFYVFLPFFGPYTLRDSIGFAGEQFLDPVYYLNIDPLAKLSITGFKTVNNVSLQLGTYEAIKEAALVPYEAIRDGYLQRRRKEVAD